MTKRLIRSIPLFLIVSITTPAWVQAQISPDETSIQSAETTEAGDTPPESPEIVITATRTEKSIHDIPAGVHILDAVKISEGQFRTIPEMLRELPGIMIQKTGHGQGSPFIRGFTGFRTLMMVDGIRLNNSVFRDGPNQYWNTIDPQSIARLEVVKGPSSVLYGSDAIGGTVNAFTKEPWGYGTGVQFGGRGYARFSLAERSSIVRGEGSYTLDNSLGLFIGGTSRDFGDLEAGRPTGRQNQTGYSELDADIKLVFNLDENRRLIFAHQRVDLDDAERTHKTIFGESFHGTTLGNEKRRVLNQNRDLTYLQYQANNLGGFIDSAKFSVSHQLQAENRFRIKSNDKKELQGFDVDTFGLTAQFETPSALGHWTWGAEYYRDEVDSFKVQFPATGPGETIRIQGPVGDDASYDLAGVYVQDEIAVNENLDLIVGGRFTYARAVADKVEDPTTNTQISISDDYNSFVGSARFLYRLPEDSPWANFNIFGGVSQAFRAPNLSDLTRFDTARTNEIQTPSPNLDPEQFISFELGIKGGDETHTAQLSFFHTIIDDLIIRKPTGATIGGDQEVRAANGGSGFVQGIEFDGRWNFSENWTAFGSYTWLEGEVDTFPTSAPLLVREPLSRLMPMSGLLGLRWEPPHQTTGDYWLEGLVSMAARQDKLSTRDLLDTSRIPPGGTPGYAIFTLRGGWEIQPNLTLTAALENILNKDYRIHGSGLNEPGLNLILGLDWRF